MFYDDCASTNTDVDHRPYSTRVSSLSTVPELVESDRGVYPKCYTEIPLVYIFVTIERHAHIHLAIVKSLLSS
jgi:hypothetical protein